METIKKEEFIISLGGGCDVVTEFLQPARLHSTTHFFDFLWNLDGGLENVTQIIDNRFEGFNHLEDYIFKKHPQWNTPLLDGKISLAGENLNQYQLVHKEYQDIAFVHHQKNQQLVDSFNRKVNRFLDLLSSNKPLCFIYYRQYHAPIKGNYFNDWDYNVVDKIEHLEKETEAFVNTLEQNFPKKDFRIISLFMEPYPPIKGINEKIDQAFKKIKHINRVYYDRVYHRGTPAAKASWQVLLKYF